MSRTATEYLKGEVERLKTEALAITRSAEDANRGMTDGERSEVEGLVAKATETKARIQELDDNEKLRAGIESLTPQTVVEASNSAPVAAKSIGEAFVKSDSWQAVKARGNVGQWRTEPLELPHPGMKANETIVGTNVELGGYTNVSQLVDIAKQPNTLLGVLPQATSDNFSIRYIAETVATNAADSVAEQGAKPQSVLQFDNVDLTLHKVATVLFVSDEFVSDVSGMRSYLDGRLASFVGYEEEDQVLNGAGAGSNENGLLDKVTQTQAAGGFTLADAIYKAKTKVRTGSFLEPTHILMNPTDWEIVRLQKDANDNYLNGLGPFVGGATEPPVWGLTPIVTTRMTAGTALVATMSPMAVQLFRKGGITVEATNSHASQFLTNEIAIRAESRVAIAVYRPGAFCEVTGITA